MKQRSSCLAFAVIYFILIFPSITFSGETIANEMYMKFKNFITCELTRTSATNHFNGKSFKITMINLFDVKDELDIQIISGAVQCFVEKKHVNLYVSLGIKKVFDKKAVSYYVIRPHDFSILATELIQYPYKERCPWSQYWIDID